MLHTKLRGYRPTVSGVETFKAFLLSIDRRPSWTFDQHFISMHLKAYIQNLVKNVNVIPEESTF